MKRKTRKIRKRDRDRKRAAFNRLADAVGRYLETIGWKALVVGAPMIRGIPEAAIGRYEFSVSFTGGKLRAALPGPDAP